MFEFQEFPKIPRLNRDIIVTEKIDGSNACIIVSDDGKELGAQSRKKLITPSDDNFGFAKWMERNRDELVTLGPGRHYGEWWGNGIQRGYDLKEKRFSLFNTSRWATERPSCCGVVPVLYEGPFVFAEIQRALDILRIDGSRAAPGYNNAEGVVVFHTAGNLMFKATIKDDEKPKGAA